LNGDFLVISHDIFLKKVSTANSMIRNLGNCSLNLKLVSEDANKTRKILNLELSIAQFYEIYNELQKIKGMMDFIN
jgi:homoserine trans-succinylase